MSTIADRLRDEERYVDACDEAADALERCEALLTEWIGVDSNTAGTSQALVLRAKTRAELARLKGGA